MIAFCTNEILHGELGQARIDEYNIESLHFFYFHSFNVTESISEIYLEEAERHRVELYQWSYTWILW